MTTRNAIHILMLSPIYFRLTTKQRLELIKEYCMMANRSSTSIEKQEGWQWHYSSEGSAFCWFLYLLFFFAEKIINDQLSRYKSHNECYVKLFDLTGRVLCMWPGFFLPCPWDSNLVCLTSGVTGRYIWSIYLIIFASAYFKRLYLHHSQKKSTPRNPPAYFRLNTSSRQLISDHFHLF